MYRVWTAPDMSKRFKEVGKDISPTSIHHFAKLLGYHKKKEGYKVGYDKSLYTMLCRHERELLAYNAMEKEKKSKPKTTYRKKIDTTDNYYMFNGERDRADYDFEKDESVIRKAIIEAINKLDLYDASLTSLNESNADYPSNGIENQYTKKRIRDRSDDYTFEGRK